MFDERIDRRRLTMANRDTNKMIETARSAHVNAETLCGIGSTAFLWRSSIAPKANIATAA